MKRQNIIIDNITYIVDLYDAIEDLSRPPLSPHYCSFLMIRNGNLVNDIFTDTDVLLIEKTIFDDCILEDGSIDLNKLNESIAFPMTGSTKAGYSRKYTDFNADLNKYNFKVGSLIEKIYDLSEESIAEYNAQYASLFDVSSFSDSYQAGFNDAMDGKQKDPTSPESNTNGITTIDEDEYNEGYDAFIRIEPKDFGPDALLPCDTVKIYGPTIKSLINAIFDIEVFINDIRFHVLCRRSQSCMIDSDNEFKVGNFTYSEYLELHVPNISKLLSSSNYYYKDIYNISSFRKKTILSAMKTNVETKDVSEISKILHYTNGNLTNVENVNYIVDGDLANTINDATSNTSINDEQSTISNGVQASSGVTINVSPKQPKNLVETTKFVINKKTSTTKTITFDETITILQTILATYNSGSLMLIGRVECIMSNNIAVSSYDVKVGNDILDFDGSNIYAKTEFQIDGSQHDIQIFGDDMTNAIWSTQFDMSPLKVIDDTLFCSMHMFGMPSIIEKNDSFKMETVANDSWSHTKISGSQDAISIDAKTYYDDSSNDIAQAFALQAKFILYPCSSYDDATSRYVQDTMMNLDVFSKNYHITMKNSFRFATNEPGQDKGALIVSSKFEYPKNFGNVNEAYLYLMNENACNYTRGLEQDEFDEDEFPASIETCGFIVDIALDKLFKRIVCSDTINIPIETIRGGTVIDDFTYSLSTGNLNVDWKSYPEILVVRVRYVDKHTGTTIEGNHLVITKEIFKYMLNGNAGRRINVKKLNAKQLNIEDAMNYIDKIQCTIVKSNPSVVSSTNDIAKNQQKILYRPIFYKAKDLEQMKLKYGITQNVGLNLSSMMSKVDTFKVMIDGKEYIEIGRNDAYVIFKINALELNGAAGQYTLLNQDNEYISDGTWYTY